MVIDTSAIVAILMHESETVVFSDILASEPSLVISPVTLHEASVVMATKKKHEGADLVDDLMRNLRIMVPASTAEDAIAAREAYFRYGRGYHPARLNLADCFAYALAKARDEALLFKGDDFAKTDVVPAWRP
jgi:ribonuclease VapC